MKQFITLILMLSIVFTFTQKVTAAAPLLNAEMASMVNCPMSMSADDAHMDISKTDCDGNEVLHSMDCQSDCDAMTVVSVIYFIDHEQSLIQASSFLSYQSGTSAAPHYFPESLYQPPFLS